MLQSKSLNQNKATFFAYFLYLRKRLPVTFLICRYNIWPPESLLLSSCCYICEKLIKIRILVNSI